MTTPAPPVTHIQTVYTIQPHEIACWLAVVRTYLDAVATLGGIFNGYQLYRSIVKSHVFMLELIFLVDKSVIQAALETPSYKVYEAACRPLVAAKTVSIWSQGEVPPGIGEHKGWVLIEEK